MTRGRKNPSETRFHGVAPIKYKMRFNRAVGYGGRR